jgi:hypothetical protein
MPSIETGHAKNVANFASLISFCTACGATYNPSKTFLQLPSLKPQLAAARASLQLVKTTKTAYENAINAREIVMADLKPITIRIITVLEATDAAIKTVDDARIILTRIQGRGRKPKEVIAANAAAIAAGEEPIKTISTSQQNYNKLVDHFEALIVILTAERLYKPNETELQLPTLNVLLADMKIKNEACINSWTVHSNACNNRNKLLYGELTGMVDTASEVKTYLSSVLGRMTPEFEQVSELQFIRRID